MFVDGAMGAWGVTDEEAPAISARPPEELGRYFALGLNSRGLGKHILVI